MLKSFSLKLVSGLCIFLYTLSVNAMVTYDTTRVIYDERGEVKSVSFLANNTLSTLAVEKKVKPQPFLVQAKMLSSSLFKKNTGSNELPFFISAPLQVIQPGMGGTFTFYKRESSRLPEDRESLFWVSLKQKPQLDSNKKNQLAIDVTTEMKFFYRPKNIKGSAVEAVKNLVVTRSPGKLVIKNLSAFYVNFFELNIGNDALFSLKNGLSPEMIEREAMIAPFDQMTVNLRPGQRGPVTWRAINDLGSVVGPFTSP
ncbi:molecular chaperone (plasmid) [Pantoea sp. BJ2]|uniref:Molecular chaperone n=1 Tax=Pantoea sp. BJ2 TaxID=3141322 RepID=A0AAU7U2Y6_9GAMM